MILIFEGYFVWLEMLELISTPTSMQLLYQGGHGISNRVSCH